LSVPIFDMVLVVYSRALHRKSIFLGGRDHTFHRLVSLNLDPTRSVLTMQIVSILLGLTAFILLETTVLLANIAFGLIVLGGLVITFYLVRQDLNVV